MTRTPLDAWIKAKIGQHEGDTLDAGHLYGYQTHKLREVIAYARKNSPFYRKHFSGVPEGFPFRPHDLAQLPFTTETDLRKHHLDMLCVSQSHISRVVTLFTSGSTAAPKRLFFTDEDLELTIDFFHHGMTTLTRSGSRVMINTSPEPFSNWLVSVAEDITVLGGIWLAVQNPVLFLVLLLLFIILMIWLLPKLWKFIKKVFTALGRLFKTNEAQAPAASEDRKLDPPTQQ